MSLSRFILEYRFVLPSFFYTKMRNENKCITRRQTQNYTQNLIILCRIGGSILYYRLYLVGRVFVLSKNFRRNIRDYVVSLLSFLNFKYMSLFNKSLKQLFIHIYPRYLFR